MEDFLEGIVPARNLFKNSNKKFFYIRKYSIKVSAKYKNSVSMS